MLTSSVALTSAPHPINSSMTALLSEYPPRAAKCNGVDPSCLQTIAEKSTTPLQSCWRKTIRKAKNLYSNLLPNSTSLTFLWILENWSKYSYCCIQFLNVIDINNINCMWEKFDQIQPRPKYPTQEGKCVRNTVKHKAVQTTPVKYMANNCWCHCCMKRYREDFSWTSSHESDSKHYFVEKKGVRISKWRCRMMRGLQTTNFRLSALFTPTLNLYSI